MVARKNLKARPSVDRSLRGSLVFEDGKSSIDLSNDDTMSDGEEVASYVPAVGCTKIRPPGEKSIWCRKFGDGVGPGGKGGSLRWGSEAPNT